MSAPKKGSDAEEAFYYALLEKTRQDKVKWYNMIRGNGHLTFRTILKGDISVTIMYPYRLLANQPNVTRASMDTWFYLESKLAGEIPEESTSFRIADVRLFEFLESEIQPISTHPFVLSLTETLKAL